MKQVYIFSGLGADERAFKFLSFENCSVNFIKWIIPDNNESITSYAKKLALQITKPNAIFIGLSFGGMMAVEVAKLLKPQQLILIASAKTKYEIPFYYRFTGLLNLHKLLPVTILKKPSFITNWFFGVTNVKDKLLLAEILRDTNKIFLKWAINTIVHWQNTSLVNNCTHIHGTADRILPYLFVKADIDIKDGGHFMTINKSAELNDILHKLLRP